uniref:Uncharacterized protein n=1 Tax=Caenorhabditis japonica TaxID=281687 RepID=A0A8R1IJA9_CAEJA
MRTDSGCPLHKPERVWGNFGRPARDGKLSQKNPTCSALWMMALDHSAIVGEYIINLALLQNACKTVLHLQDELEFYCVFNRLAT